MSKINRFLPLLERGLYFMSMGWLLVMGVRALDLPWHRWVNSMNTWEILIVVGVAFSSLGIRLYRRYHFKKNRVVVPATPVAQPPALERKDAFQTMRLQHCAMMIGVYQDSPVTYLIPCIGNAISTKEDIIPDSNFSMVVTAAAELREKGVQVKILMPVDGFAGVTYIPPVGRYTPIISHFPVPKSFLNKN